jgi:hypothetical protein
MAGTPNTVPNGKAGSDGGLWINPIGTTPAWLGRSSWVFGVNMGRARKDFTWLPIRIRLVQAKVVGRLTGIRFILVLRAGIANARRKPEELCKFREGASYRISSLVLSSSSLLVRQPDSLFTRRIITYPARAPAGDVKDTLIATIDWCLELDTSFRVE